MSRPSDHRVVQWATGNIGTRALRAVIDHPALELVGVHVYAEDKIGRDAGELCGAAPTGVTATNDIEEVIALAPDCVLYMPRYCNVEEICRLLAAGSNVVTTRGEFHDPASLASDVRAQVEAATAEGATSLHSTGSSPGFITEAVPIVLASIQRRLECITIHESADLSSRDSAGLLFGVMGFGQRPTSYDPRRLTHGTASFGPSLRATAAALGLPLDEVTAEGGIAVAGSDVGIAAGRLAAGTVAAQRMTVSGWRAGAPVIRFQSCWYCTSDLEPAWDVRPTGWHVEVEGDAPLSVDISFPVPLERWASVSPGLTAHRAVNAIPVVCAASPGIRTTADLPQIIARFG